MDTGFITLHRKITDNPIWKNSQLSHLFLTLLLWANHEEKKTLFNGKIEVIGRGQLITGRFALEEVTGIPAGSVWKYLQTLKNLEIISIKSTNKFSLITIVKYSDYQDIEGVYGSKGSNRVAPKEQQRSTNNHVNNVNKESGAEAPTLAQEFFTDKVKQKEMFNWLVSTGCSEEVARTELWEFIKYWQEPNAKGKQRWQGQKFFDIKRRIGTWMRNVK